MLREIITLESLYQVKNCSVISGRSIRHTFHDKYDDHNFERSPSIPKEYDGHSSMQVRNFNWECCHQMGSLNAQR